MAHEVVTAAYRTKLGNPSAKSVLVLVGHAVNPDGYGWPSMAYIAVQTELSERTVMRIVQVFVAIGLIAKIWRGKRKTWGLQLALEKLECDLSQEFVKAYAEAQGRLDECRTDGERRTDSEQDVAPTLFTVAPTQKSVAATIPPHPHIGGTVKDPSGKYPPTPSLREGECDSPSEELQAGDPIEAAVNRVMRECGWTDETDRRLRRVVRAQIELEEQRGESPPATAAAMADAHRRYGEQGLRLRNHCKPRTFIGSGMWRNSKTWHWDNEFIKHERLQAEARAGSFA